MDSSEVISGKASAFKAEAALQVYGQVFVPGDQGYDEARRAWNLTIDQRPALIVVPETVSDIQSAVRYAVSQGLTVAVQ
jgi:FAD/FMN-containing dehydrogenase